MFRNFFINNKKLIFQIVLLVVIYKLILLIAAFFYYYYTFKIEPFKWSMLLDFWYHWDSGHYLRIASEGYNLKYNDMAFFPLFPLLVRIFGNLAGYKLAAYLINTFALVGGLIGFYKLVKIDFSERAAWRSIFYLLLFPTAIFLTAYYTESLFLFLAIWNFYFVRIRKWRTAGIFGFFAALIRIEGIILFIFMLFEYLQEIKFNFKEIRNNIFYCLAPLLGLSVYAIFLKLKFGDPFLFLKAQSAWDKHFTFPWESIGDYITTLFWFKMATTPFYLSRFFDLVFFSLSLIFGTAVLLKLRISYGLYIIFSILMVSFSADLASTNRRSILLFPILILLTKWGKNQIVNFVILMLFSGLFYLFTFRFIHELWAG